MDILELIKKSIDGLRSRFCVAKERITKQGGKNNGKCRRGESKQDLGTW